jgi:hypothetical protein
MKRAQSVNIEIVSLEGFTPVDGVQNQSNLSVPNVRLSDSALPTVPQDQRDTLD